MLRSGAIQTTLYHMVLLPAWVKTRPLAHARSRTPQPQA